MRAGAARTGSGAAGRETARIALVHVEGDDVLERDLPILVRLHDALVRQHWRRTGRQPEHKGAGRRRRKVVDALDDVVADELADLRLGVLDHEPHDENRTGATL